MSVFVYVSNAEDGDIGSYRLTPDGGLQAVARTKVASLVGPMAVSPDRRHLYVAARSQPYSVHGFAIDPVSGTLAALTVAPLAASMPYITLDRSGRFLLAASYGAGVVSVNAVGEDGRVAAAPQQVIPVGRNAHSIRADASNRFVYVPCLGTDQIFQFVFDQKSGRLASNTPAIAPMNPMTGPRHFVTSHDNQFLYVLSELLATVTTFALDQNTGLLTEQGSACGLPPDSLLAPGAPRGPGGPDRPRDNDIWAADIHLTPDGRFLYVSERTSSTLAAFAVDAESGTLRYLGSTPTENQPRGFAIDPNGKFLVACGEKSTAVSIYAIDQANGALRPLQKIEGGKGANWIEIVSFE